VSPSAGAGWTYRRRDAQHRSPALGVESGTLTVVTEVLRGLDDIDWSALHDAYGSAEEIPSQLRALLADDAESRASALETLWGTVWHQGTVYECTPLTVPFLVEVVAAKLDDATRAQVAFLLASIASAWSFVLPEQPTVMLRPAWLREPGDDVPVRDLAEESRLAVAACGAQLARVLAEVSGAVQAGLVAVAAAIANALPVTARETLRRLEADSDVRLATAARVARHLADDSLSLTDADLPRLAEIDDDATDFLDGIADWPVRVRAVELVRELGERVVADELA
jgi:hypothetical protein